MTRVRYPSCSPFLLRDIIQPNVRSAEGVGELYVPEEVDGKCPGVVVVEGLGGLKNGRERAYGAFLAAQGCVALVADSFATRGAAWLYDDMRALVVTEAMMLADAYGALRYLCRHPHVDPEHVYVIGFSYGGMIAVLCAYEQFAEQLAPQGERFAGHLSYYGCSIPRLAEPRTTGAPALILLGEKDRNVSIPRWRIIADDLRAGGSAVDLDVIDGAYHQWDGQDVEMRHVRFNLRKSAIRVDGRNEAYDEASGLRMRGPASRALIIARHADSSGYDILRNEDALRYSDERLLSFIETVSPDSEHKERHVEATRPSRSDRAVELLNGKSETGGR